MHIAMDLLIAEKEPGGMLFSARALLEGLARIDQINTYTIITTQPWEYQMLTAAANMHVYAVNLPSHHALLIQHQLIVPDILHRLQPDVLHVPAFAAPIGWNGPLVLTVHDLAFLTIPEQYSLYTRLYWQYLLRESTRRASYIIAVSTQTSTELMTRWSIEQERIRIVHNALRPSLSPITLSAQEILMMQQRYGGYYLLHVGRIIPRKNVEKLIEAFDLLAAQFIDLQLVLVGGVGYDSEDVLNQITRSANAARIHQVGWVPDQDLRLLYAAASILVFPSCYEGFGLPTLEAMAYGLPIVASPQAASQEIAGEAVVRVDCSDAALLADALMEVLTNTSLRTQLACLGKEQAKPFHCEACAAATLQVYQEAACIT